MHKNRIKIKRKLEHTQVQGGKLDHVRIRFIPNKRLDSILGSSSFPEETEMILLFPYLKMKAYTEGPWEKG